MEKAEGRTALRPEAGDRAPAGAGGSRLHIAAEAPVDLPGLIREQGIETGHALGLEACQTGVQALHLQIAAVDGHLLEDLLVHGAARGIEGRQQAAVLVHLQGQGLAGHVHLPGAVLAALAVEQRHHAHDVPQHGQTRRQAIGVCPAHPVAPGGPEGVDLVAQGLHVLPVPGGDVRPGKIRRHHPAEHVVPEKQCHGFPVVPVGRAPAADQALEPALRAGVHAEIEGEHLRPDLDRPFLPVRQDHVHRAGAVRPAGILPRGALLGQIGLFRRAEDLARHIGRDQAGGEQGQVDDGIGIRRQPALDVRQLRGALQGRREDLSGAGGVGRPSGRGILDGIGAVDAVPDAPEQGAAARGYLRAGQVQGMIGPAPVLAGDAVDAVPGHLPADGAGLAAYGPDMAGRRDGGGGRHARTPAPQILQVAPDDAPVLFVEHLDMGLLDRLGQLPRRQVGQQRVQLLAQLSGESVEGLHHGIGDAFPIGQAPQPGRIGHLVLHGRHQPVEVPGPFRQAHARARSGIQTAQLLIGLAHMLPDDPLAGGIDLPEGKAHVPGREGALRLLGGHDVPLGIQLCPEPFQTMEHPGHALSACGQACLEGVQIPAHGVHRPGDRGKLPLGLRNGLLPPGIVPHQTHAPAHEADEIVGIHTGPAQLRHELRPEGPPPRGHHAAPQTGKIALRGRIQKPGQVGAGKGPALQGLPADVLVEQTRALGLAAIGADAVAHALGRGPVPGLFLAALRPLPEAGPDGRRLEPVRALLEADEAAPGLAQMAQVGYGIDRHGSLLDLHIKGLLALHHGVAQGRAALRPEVQRQGKGLQEGIQFVRRGLLGQPHLLQQHGVALRGQGDGGALGILPHEVGGEQGPQLPQGHFLIPGKRAYAAEGDERALPLVETQVHHMVVGRCQGAVIVLIELQGSDLLLAGKFFQKRVGGLAAYHDASLAEG